MYEEPVIDNVYLADFYQDMAKYAFPLQVYLLNARFRAQQQLVWSTEGGIQDRTIYEDSVFAWMLKDSGKMSPRDYDTYIELFNNMSNFMRKPNLIVHLDVTPEESYERIKARSRDCESTIPLEYLVDLHKAYEVFIRDISRTIPVLRVKYSSFPTPEAMAEVIVKEHQALQHVRYVDLSVEIKSPASTPERPAKENSGAVEAPVDPSKLPLRA